MRSAGLASFEKRDDDDDEVVPAGFDAFLRNWLFAMFEANI